MNMIRLIAQNAGEDDIKIVLHASIENGKLRHQEQMGYEEIDKVSLYPFVLQAPKASRDAILDFGCLNNDEDDVTHHTAKTDLFTKNIVVDEYFQFSEDGEEYTMRITHVTEIA